LPGLILSVVDLERLLEPAGNLIVGGSVVTFRLAFQPPKNVFPQAESHLIVDFERLLEPFIVGFQHESDAKRFLDALRERLAEFALSLHPEKTRLIEFGRYAAQNRKRRGLGKPETFPPVGGPDRPPAPAGDRIGLQGSGTRPSRSGLQRSRFH
jgi:hypothetical protein